MANGFDTVVDVETFELSEKYVAPFSLPQEVLSFEPDAGTIVHTFKNGDRERKLHLNTELREDEKELLRQLREKARDQGVAFMPSLTVAATRYISQARGDVDKALTLMKKTHEWRMQYFDRPMCERSILEDMSHGIAYFCGRDRSMRPTLVFRAKRIPAQWHRERNYDKVIGVVVFCVEYFLRHMVLPGRAEGINILCDMADMGISQVPVQALTEMHKSMGSHYTGRVFKFYICNLSWVLKGLVSVAKGILSDRQNQKLVFVSKKEELQKDFALHQLEADLGGTMPQVQEFLPFPLQAGPFEAGYKGGPDPSRVANVHQALTKMGHRGRIWDDEKTPEENRQLEYTEAAEDILTKCGLPIPPNCPRKPVEPEKPEKPEANQEAKEPGGASIVNVPVQGKENFLNLEDEDVQKELLAGGTPTTAVDDEDDVILTDAKVNSTFPFFCCTVSPCSKRR